MLGTQSIADLNDWNVHATARKAFFVHQIFSLISFLLLLASSSQSVHPIAGSISCSLRDVTNRKLLPISGTINIVLLSDDSPAFETTFKGEVTEGRFKVTNLPPGRYVVMDLFSEYVIAETSISEITVPPEGTVTNVEILLEKGTVVRGRVIDADGQPVSDAFVKVASIKVHEIRPLLQFNRGVTTNADGIFSITVPNDPQRYRGFSIIVNHPAYQGQMIHSKLILDQVEYNLPDIMMAKSIQLQGTITDALGGSVEKLEVLLKRHYKRLNFRGYVPLEQTVYTDSKGDFVFAGLYPTEYSLLVLRNKVAQYFLASVNPEEKSALKIRLQPCVKIKGQVIDTQSKPLKGATIIANLQMHTPGIPSVTLSTCESGPDGSFELNVLRADSRNLNMVISKDGYLSQVYTNVRVTKNKLTVTLEQGVSIKGYVFLPPSVSTKGEFTVKLFYASTSVEPSLDSLGEGRKPLASESFPRADGKFAIDNLAREEYALYIVGDGLSASGVKVDIAKGDQQVALLASSGVTLRGRLLWANTRQPVFQASVLRSWYPWELEIYDNMGSFKRFETLTNDKGEFMFTNLTEGWYKLQISYAEASLAAIKDQPQRNIFRKQVDILVRGEKEAEYTFYLGRGDSIR